MSRYVDIEPYEEYVLQRHYRNSMGECIETVPLYGLPIADVQEVRHGRWIIYTVSPWDGEDVKCSVCGEKGCAPYWDYCPHCGSQMVDVVSENEL